MNFREEKDGLELTLSPCTLWRWKVEPRPACWSGFQSLHSSNREVFLASSVCALQPPVYQGTAPQHCLCHDTVCTTFLVWLFSPPSSSFSFTSLTSAPFIFLVFQMGSVMAVWYLKRKLHVAFCSFERYFC